MNEKIDIELKDKILRLGTTLHVLPYNLEQYILLSHLEKHKIELSDFDGHEVSDWIRAINAMLYSGRTMTMIKQKTVTKSDLNEHATSFLKAYVFDIIPPSAVDYQVSGTALKLEFFKAPLEQFFINQVNKLIKSNCATVEEVEKVRITSGKNQQVSLLHQGETYVKWRLNAQKNPYTLHFEIEVNGQWHTLLNENMKPNTFCEAMVKRKPQEGMTFRIIDRDKHEIVFTRFWKEVVSWHSIKTTLM